MWPILAHESQAGMIEKGKLFLCEGLSKRTSTVAGGILPVFLKILLENEAKKGGKPETES